MRLCLLLTCLLAAPPVVAEGPKKLVVSSLKLSPAALEGEWTGPTGLVIDSLEGEAPKEVNKTTFTLLKQQLSPHGVYSVADYTYRRKDDPLEQVTVRIFLSVVAASSSARCRVSTS